MVRPNDTSEPKAWGTQSEAVWPAGNSKAQPVANLGPPPGNYDNVDYGRRPMGLWRIAVSVERTTETDNATLMIRWGAGANAQELSGVLLPCLAYVPGCCQLEVKPSGVPTSLLKAVTQVTPVHGYARQRVFTLLDATAGAVTLPATAIAVQALAASTVTPQGAPAPIAVAAGVRLEVGGLTVVNTGQVLVEHEL